MTLQEAIQILKLHNIWRRGAETGQANPTQLGIAIDTVVDYYDHSPVEQEKNCAFKNKDCGECKGGDREQAICE